MTPRPWWWCRWCRRSRLEGRATLHRGAYCSPVLPVSQGVHGPRPAQSGTLRQGTLREVLDVDVRVVLELHERWLHRRVDRRIRQLLVADQPGDRLTCAEANVWHAVFGCLQHQRHNVRSDLVWRHHTGNLWDHVDGGHTVRIAHALRILLHKLWKQMLHCPLGTPM